MIKAVHDREKLCLTEDYYSGRVLSMFEAYGGGYDFCRFYRCKSGSGMIYNSSAVFGGKWQDIKELGEFVSVNSPQTAEMPIEISCDLSIEGYEKRRRLLFEINGADIREDIYNDISLEKMYGIVSASFGDIEHDLWYADMSHRIRHKVSRAFMLKDSACACVDFVYDKKAYISQLAVSPQNRGNGLGGKLAGHIAALYGKDGVKCFLWAYEELWEYYRGLGFNAVSEDNIYTKIM